MRYDPTAQIASAKLPPTTETELKPRRRRRRMHRLPDAETRLRRALDALYGADCAARRYYRHADDAALMDALYAVRCASVGIRLALTGMR